MEQIGFLFLRDYMFFVVNLMFCVKNGLEDFIKNGTDWNSPSLEDFIKNGKGISDENDVLENANEEIVGCKEQLNESLITSIGMEFNSIEEAYYF